MLNADLLYSVLLMNALVAATPGAIPGLNGLTPVARTLADNARLQQALPPLLVVATLTGTASMIIHATACHGEKSPEPMAAGEFLVNHKAFVLVAFFILADAVGWRAQRPGGK